MMFEHRSQNSAAKVALLVGAALVLIVGVVLIMVGKTSAPSNPIESTNDDKNVEGWSIITLPHITFQAPSTLGTSYVSVVDWPPRVEIQEGPLSCTEAGEPTERAGKTELRNKHNHSYCVTERVEGAAGSIYTQYAYAFEEGSRVVILTFSTRKVQCANFGEDEMALCEAEQQSFSMDDLIDSIATTATIQE